MTSSIEATCEAALQVALGLAERRYRCFPCQADKSPATYQGFQNATFHPSELKKLWRKHPGPLVGVATGERSDITVLDVDSAKHSSAAAWLAANEHRLAGATRHTTRSGGYHYLFKHHPGLGSRQNIVLVGRKIEGLDFRADGGYVVWWPGQGLPVADGQIDRLPDWLLIDLEKRAKDAADRQAAAHFTSILPGLLASRQYRALTPDAKRLHILAEARFRTQGFTMPYEKVQKLLRIGSSTMASAMKELEALGILRLLRPGIRPSHPDAPPGKGLAAEYGLPHRQRGVMLGVGDVLWREPNDQWFAGQWRIHTRHLMALLKHHTADEMAILARFHLCPHNAAGGVDDAKRLQLPRRVLRDEGMSCSAASRAFGGLLKKHRIEEVAPASGRRPALYRLAARECRGGWEVEKPRKGTSNRVGGHNAGSAEPPHSGLASKQ